MKLSNSDFQKYLMQIDVRSSVVRLFPNSGQVAKSSIFVCSNCPENLRWPTWVETPFSEWPDSLIRRNLENCRLTIRNTVLFS